MSSKRRTTNEWGYNQMRGKCGVVLRGHDQMINSFNNSKIVTVLIVFVVIKERFVTDRKEEGGWHGVT